MITAFLRTIILYGLLILGLRLTGKRQIGQLEPIELVLTMLLSDLAAVPMQDFGIPLLHGVVPIVTLLALSTLLSCLSLRYIRFRDALCGTASVVIRDGQLQESVMRRNRLTPDELLEELRLQGITGIEQVKYAVLENSGQLSVLPRADHQPVTPRQMKLEVEDDVYLPLVIVSDGHVLHKNMQKLGLDEPWLRSHLRQERIASPREVFLMTADKSGAVVLQRKDGGT